MLNVAAVHNKCHGRPPTRYWIGRTSRDQYTGVFFGLGAAWDLIGDAGVHATVQDLVTRLLDNLMQNNGALVMPNGEVSTVFFGRADHAQVG